MARNIGSCEDRVANIVSWQQVIEISKCSGFIWWPTKDGIDISWLYTVSVP